LQKGLGKSDLPIPRVPYRWIRFAVITLLSVALVIAMAIGWRALDDRRQRRALVTLQNQDEMTRLQLVRLSELKKKGVAERHLRDRRQAVINDWLLWSDAEKVEQLELFLEEDRRVTTLIKYVNSRKGKVQTESTVTPEWMQPALGDGFFVSVVSIGLRSVTRTDLLQLKSCSTLKSLSIHGARFTPTDWSLFQNFPALQKLELDHSGVTDSALKELCALSQLKSLLIHGSQLIDQGLDLIGQLTRLEELKLDGSKGITDEGIVKLAPLENLRFLDLHHAKITGEGFEHLTTLTQLRKLNIHGTRASDIGMKAIAKLSALEELRIDQNGVSDNGVMYLKNLRRLRRLHVGRGVTARGVRKLEAVLPELQVVRNH
jgi:hypothetical protein